jgi:protein O-GlcNAc transferase
MPFRFGAPGRHKIIEGISLMNNAQEIFDRALAAHGTGNLPEAMRLYQETLLLRPEHPLVLNRLAMCQSAQGLDREALATLHQAVQVAPQLADTHLNFGLILQKIDRQEDALAAVNRALRLAPTSAYAWFVHGNLLQAMRQPLDAVNSYGKAVELAPGLAAAWLNRSNAFLKTHQPAQALDSAHRALAIEPDMTLAHLSIGRALIDMNQPSEALLHFDQVLARQPQLREARLGRAQALAKQHDEAGAADEFDRILMVDPSDADALNGLGVALESMGRLEDASKRYDGALAVRPAFVEAWVNQGRVLRLLDRKDSSAQALQQALKLDDSCGQAMMEMAELAAAVHMYDDAEHWWSRAKRVLTHSELLIGSRLATHAATLCRWVDNDEHELAFRQEILAGGAAVANPFSALGWMDDPKILRAAARHFAAIHYPVGKFQFAPEAERPAGRLRVAYISGDFHKHATMILAARLFELHDRQRFEVWGVSIGPDSDDSMRRRALAAFEHFLDARKLSDDALAIELRRLGIDIAIDLKGYTQDARVGIFSRRCAPIQVNYLGYPGTMGTEYHDYLIADPIVAPRHDFENFSERIVWLPDCYQVNDDTRSSTFEMPARSALGLPERGFVFCCFNNTYKLKPALFDVWMRLLQAVEGSVLWLWCDEDVARGNLVREAEKRGVAGQRLVFADRSPYDQHLARLGQADLFLDTLPYGAHTTASDALWAGVPLLTCVGKTFPGRVAASLLTAAALPELITRSLAEYERLATQLAQEPSLYQAIRGRVAAARGTSPLFDSDRFRRHMETALENMFSLYAQRKTPKSFRVLPDGMTEFL